MCGLTGLVRAGGSRDADTTVVSRMTTTLAHRGPDAGAVQTVPAGGATATLGHRRLSIIDLSTAGQQPMPATSQPVWLVFNGEIYNYRELRRRFARDYEFRTDTDSEVILAAYLAEGDRCVEELRGMFAFAVFDARGPGRLLIARDRFGQKPLFYRHDPITGELLFASELKSLMAAGIERAVDIRSLALYLTYQYVPHPDCILEGARKLPPASRLVWENGQIHVERYWEMPFCEPVEDRDRSEWQRQLRETLTESVRLRMRSDVPIGAFLSGGVDSSITAGLMQQLSNDPIHTFSIGFPNPAYDETEYAEAAARKLGTRHHVDRVHPEAMRDLRRLVWHYDEPFGDSSALPTTYVSHYARKHVTVSLSGDGGDELFAGYNRYRAVGLAARFDRFPGPWLWRLPFWKWLPTGRGQRTFLHRARRFAEGMAAGASDRYLNWISHFDPDRIDWVFSQRSRAALGSESTATLVRDLYNRCDCRDLITQTCCVDVHSYLPGDILTKVDIASMSASLECRSPFLDHHVAELAARMPIDLKVEAGRQKAILIDTFSDLLPPEIQTRSKMGFGVPIEDWFRGELRPLIDDVLLSDRSLGRGIFDPDAISQLVSEHHTGRWNHAYRLWTLLMLELWHRAYLDGDLPHSPAEVDLGIDERFLSVAKPQVET